VSTVLSTGTYKYHENLVFLEEDSEKYSVCDPSVMGTVILADPLLKLDVMVVQFELSRLY